VHNQFESKTIFTNRGIVRSESQRPNGAVRRAGIAHCDASNILLSGSVEAQQKGASDFAGSGFIGSGSTKLLIGEDKCDIFVCQRSSNFEYLNQTVARRIPIPVF
jgi:hypothetical protein